MEEQTVPSAGFSPQHEYMDCGTGYYGMPPQQPFYNNQQHPQQHQHQVLHKANSGSGQMEYMADYFDLSLLGDAYEDKDMATVPSPSSWPHLGIMEPAQQMSFYASSPADYRAFSPDCSPVKPVACENGGGGSGPNTPSPPPPQPAQAAALNYPVGSPAGQLTEDCRNNILLRQCLEDNTFLEKYNIKPLDLPMHEDGNMVRGPSPFLIIALVNEHPPYLTSVGLHTHTYFSAWDNHIINPVSGASVIPLNCSRSFHFKCLSLFARTFSQETKKK